jgi:hypothetical protein
MSRPVKKLTRAEPVSLEGLHICPGLQTDYFDPEHDRHHADKGDLRKSASVRRGNKDDRHDEVCNVRPVLRPQRAVLKPARLLSPTVKSAALLPSRPAFQTRVPTRRRGRAFASNRGGNILLTDLFCATGTLLFYCNFYCYFVLSCQQCLRPMKLLQS